MYWLSEYKSHKLKQWNKRQIKENYCSSGNIQRQKIILTAIGFVLRDVIGQHVKISHGVPS